MESWGGFPSSPLFLFCVYKEGEEGQLTEVKRRVGGGAGVDASSWASQWEAGSVRQDEEEEEEDGDHANGK